MKKGDIVLVRDSDTGIWRLDVFDVKYDEEDIYYCILSTYRQCILYKGNEGLLGTDTDYIDKKAHFKFGDPVVVKDINGRWIYSIYSHYAEEVLYPHNCVGETCYEECLPLEGNEHLIGKASY